MHKVDIKERLILTFELPTFQQCSRLFQGEEFLNGDKVIIHP